MKPIQAFVAGSHDGPAWAGNEQRTVNFLIEVDQSSARTPTQLVGVFGLELISTIGGLPVKAMIEADEVAYVAMGQNFGRLDEDFNFTVLGNFSGTSRISMVTNGLQVLLVDGLSGFVWDIADQTWSQIVTPGFVYGATQVTYQDGYGIIALPDSQQFGISGILDFMSWDAIDFTSAEALPDNVATVVSNHRVLHVFGTASLELFVNSGAALFPFERIEGTYFDVGCLAPYSATVADDSIFFLGGNNQGAKAFYRMEGNTPKRISTVALEAELSTYARVDDAYAAGLDIQRHPLYIVTFPTANKTWCYDAHSGEWTEILEWDGADWDRYRLNCFATLYGRRVIGDYRTGKLYEPSFDVHTNDEDPIRCVRVTPYIYDNGKRIFHSRLELMVQPGVGLPIGPIEGVEPEWCLRFSDNGRDWSNEMRQPMGRQGRYNVRVAFNRLGAAYQRTYEVSSTAPVKRVLMGALLEAEAGK